MKKNRNTAKLPQKKNSVIHKPRKKRLMWVLTISSQINTIGVRYTPPYCPGIAKHEIKQFQAENTDIDSMQVIIYGVWDI